jgi:hypothetical protein
MRYKYNRVVLEARLEAAFFKEKEHAQYKRTYKSVEAGCGRERP